MKVCVCQTENVVMYLRYNKIINILQGMERI
jgi:hypothetical protein